MKKDKGQTLYTLKKASERQTSKNLVTVTDVM
jgi:hypothetical protein